MASDLGALVQLGDSFDADDDSVNEFNAACVAAAVHACRPTLCCDHSMVRHAH
jgi:hypothetical protein